PLGATLTTERVYAAFLGDPWQGRTFYHGHTYTGNALACAAGLASLKLFEDRHVLQNAALAATVIRQRLAGLQQHPQVAEVRQRGLMVGIELVLERDSLTPFPVEFRIGHHVTLAARRRGLILRPLGDVIVLMPAPGMTPELIGEICDKAIECIEEVVQNALRRLASGSPL
ncbi:MAG: aminotransferase class III-fold pyridoxal phosphate-dependent enzyme, partial [Planctomycetaceae bacterium]